MTLYTVRLKLPEHLPDETVFCLSEALSDVALSSAAMREQHNDELFWSVTWVMSQKPDQATLLARLALQIAAHELSAIEIRADTLIIEDLPDTDWLLRYYKESPPFSVGPFFIYSRRYTGEVPPEQIGLQIDAATAFGSGEHETTNGCLQAMLELKSQGICPWNTLDMGTGSGILAIAAWKLWKSPILAVDSEAEAIRSSEEHARINNVTLGKGTLRFVTGQGFLAPEVEESKPYELILMNILAGPVIEMAPALVRVLDENGYCILSGMLKEQADLVTSAYEGSGLGLKYRYDIGEWTTLVMHKTL